jgi:hypothetical protein
LHKPARNHNCPISATQVAGIIGVSHHSWPDLSLLNPGFLVKLEKEQNKIIQTFLSVRLFSYFGSWTENGFPMEQRHPWHCTFCVMPLNSIFFSSLLGQFISGFMLLWLLKIFSDSYYCHIVLWPVTELLWGWYFQKHPSLWSTFLTIPVHLPCVLVILASTCPLRLFQAYTYVAVLIQHLIIFLSLCLGSDILNTNKFHKENPYLDF